MLTTIKQLDVLGTMARAQRTYGTYFNAYGRNDIAKFPHHSIVLILKARRYISIVNARDRPIAVVTPLGLEYLDWQYGQLFPEYGAALTMLQLAEQEALCNSQARSSPQ